MAALKEDEDEVGLLKGFEGHWTVQIKEGPFINPHKVGHRRTILLEMLENQHFGKGDSSLLLVCQLVSDVLLVLQRAEVLGLFAWLSSARVDLVEESEEFERL